MRLPTIPYAHLLGVRLSGQPKPALAARMPPAAKPLPKPAAAPARPPAPARDAREAVKAHNARCKAILAAGVRVGEVATAMALAFDTGTPAAEAIKTLERLPEARKGDHADRRRSGLAQPAPAPAPQAAPPASPDEVARSIAAVAERCRPQPAAQTLAERMAGATRASVRP